jgi:shikimate kinase
MQHANIILIGFMGTGKSTVGQLLAERLNLTAVDMDTLIEKRAGKPISTIFRDEGESAFRRMERALAHELSQGSGQVISTGGGVVLDPENLADFQAAGLMVCLQASPEEILRRVESDQTRPLLEGDKQSRIRELYEARRTLYDAMPFQIQTDGQTPEQIAGRIEREYAAIGS